MSERSGNNFRAAVETASEVLRKTTALYEQGISRGMDEEFYTYLSGALYRQNPEALVIAASKYPEWLEPLKQRISDSIRDREDIPPVALNWLRGYLRGEGIPKATKGRPNNDGLHLIIAIAVSGIVTKHEITATRNDASPALSACDAVAIALQEAGMQPSSYEQVKRVWLTAKKIKPGFFV